MFSDAQPRVALFVARQRFNRSFATNRCESCREVKLANAPAGLSANRYLVAEHRIRSLKKHIDKAVVADSDWQW
jgi:hypothetical protein